MGWIRLTSITRPAWIGLVDSGREGELALTEEVVEDGQYGSGEGRGDVIYGFG